MKNDDRVYSNNEPNLDSAEVDFFEVEIVEPDYDFVMQAKKSYC